MYHVRKFTNGSVLPSNDKLMGVQIAFLNIDFHRLGIRSQGQTCYGLRHYFRVFLALCE